MTADPFTAIFGDARIGMEVASERIGEHLLGRDLRQGDILSIFGEAGSGKTMLTQSLVEQCKDYRGENLRVAIVYPENKSVITIGAKTKAIMERRSNVSVDCLVADFNDLEKLLFHHDVVVYESWACSIYMHAETARTNYRQQTYNELCREISSWHKEQAYALSCAVIFNERMRDRTLVRNSTHLIELSKCSGGVLADVLDTQDQSKGNLILSCKDKTLTARKTTLGSTR